MQKSKFVDKVAVVTGAGEGIGRTIAQARTATPNSYMSANKRSAFWVVIVPTVSYTHLTLPTIYSV